MPATGPAITLACESPLAAPEADNVATVERWLDAFNDGWPSGDSLPGFLTEDVRFVERPNLVSPTGSARDLAAMRAGVEAGAALLRAQHYAPIEHVAIGDRVFTRMRWTGTIGIDAGPWSAGTELTADCLAIYRLRDGRICEIEQYDCYAPPVTP